MVVAIRTSEYITSHSHTADTQDHRSMWVAGGFLLLFGRHFIS